MTVFGQIVTGGDVEEAVTAALQRWAPTYLAELERQKGLPAGSLPAPRSWSTTNRFARNPQDQLPAAIVVSPGLASRPVKDGEGRYTAWWTISVAVIVAAQDQATSERYAQLYGAALRALVIQQPSLDGFAAGVDYLNERYDGVPADFLPVGAVVQTDFNVQVAAIVTAAAGPAEPDLAPGDWPTVQTTNIEIEEGSLT